MDMYGYNEWINNHAQKHYKLLSLTSQQQIQIQEALIICLSKSIFKIKRQNISFLCQAHIGLNII